jgi:hypothetical protein
MKNWNGSNLVLAIFLDEFCAPMLSAGFNLEPLDNKVFRTPRWMKASELDQMEKILKSAELPYVRETYSRAPEAAGAERIVVQASDMFPLAWNSPSKDAVDNSVVQKYINTVIAFLLHAEILGRDDLDWKFDGKETFTLSSPLTVDDATEMGYYIEGVGFVDQSVQDGKKFTMKIKNHLVNYDRSDLSLDSTNLVAA